MESIKNVRNELLKRQEVECVVTAEKNPSFDEMRKLLAEKFASPEENITVLGVKGQFGKNKFLVRSHLYDKREGLQQILKIERTRKQKKEETKKKTDEEKAIAAEKKAKETSQAETTAPTPQPAVE